MWTCPKCGREFKRSLQDHYCGLPPATIEEYILAQRPEIQPFLSALHRIIVSALPEEEQRIAWTMPTYGKPTLLQFAACRKHVSLYAGEAAIQEFASELAGIECRKAAIYLKYGEPLPEELLAKIVRRCGREET